MTLEEARARLAPLHLDADDVMPRGDDLEVYHPGDANEGEGWTFAEVSKVAEALGVVDIDIARVVEHAQGLAIERDGGACPSCGHGDLLIVRGILGPGAAAP